MGPDLRHRHRRPTGQSPRVLRGDSGVLAVKLIESRVRPVANLVSSGAFGEDGDSGRRYDSNAPPAQCRRVVLKTVPNTNPDCLRNDCNGERVALRYEGQAGKLRGDIPLAAFNSPVV